MVDALPKRIATEVEHQVRVTTLVQLSFNVKDWTIRKIRILRKIEIFVKFEFLRESGSFKWQF